MRNRFYNREIPVASLNGDTSFPKPFCFAERVSEPFLGGKLLFCVRTCSSYLCPSARSASLWAVSPPPTPTMMVWGLRWHPVCCTFRAWTLDLSQSAAMRTRWLTKAKGARLELCFHYYKRGGGIRIVGARAAHK